MPKKNFKSLFPKAEVKGNKVCFMPYGGKKKRCISRSQAELLMREMPKAKKILKKFEKLGKKK